ncbi:MAG: TonB-dependent receptor plug domain-containing protein [Candidatus Kapabacteria bacterium]|nr:TonB-dependent receptor plug domain-containing protein [Candidatus Kapabacteria bacterium]
MRCHLVLIACLLAVAPLLLHAQIKKIVPIKQDSTRRDSLTSPIADSLDIDIPRDTIPPVPLHIPLPRHGSLTLLPMPSEHMTQRRDWQMLNYSSLPEILEWILPSQLYPLHHGFPGQFNAVSAMGGSMRDNTLLFNGRTMGDITRGAAALEHFPVEFAENISILSGTDAAVFGESAGILMNIAEPRYNTKTPYTRLWYSQGGYDFISSDGVFSQNIAPNVNMTLGFRRQSGTGRFANQSFEVWNVRGLLRWNLSPKTNVSYSHIFTNHFTGTNGGINMRTTAAPNDELTANVLLPDNNERIFRHDGTFTFSSLVADDTSSAVSASAYYSIGEWLINRNKKLALPDSDSLAMHSWTNNRIGATVRYEQRLFSGLTYRMGGEAEYYLSSTSVYAERGAGQRIAGYGHISGQFTESIALRGGVRLRNDRDRVTIAAGAAAAFTIARAVSLTVDVSQSSRLPSVAEGWQLNRENTTLILSTVRYTDSTTSATISLSLRNTLNPIRATILSFDTAGTPYSAAFGNGGSERWIQLGGEFSHSMGRLRISSFLQSNIGFTDGDQSQRFPLVYAGATAEYDIFRSATSRVFTGLRVRGRTAFRGEQFIPQQWGYAEGTTDLAAAFDGIDINAGAKLGNAFVKFSFQNIVSSFYTTLSTFPRIDRNIRLSVAWTFFD